MSLLRLEWLRLYRTHRLWILLGVFSLFGVLGPLTARYLPEIVERLGAGAEIGIPPASPELAMAQYSGNALQMGLLAVVFVAAASLGFDARREMAVFLRTRATVRSILAPRYAVNAIAAGVAVFVGSAFAYGGSVVLIAQPRPGGTIAGSLLLALYLAFSVALAGFFASLVRSVPGAALLTVGTLIALALVGLLPTLKPWLPSELVGGFDALVAGEPFTFWRSVASTVALSGGAVVTSIVLMTRREV
jgi:ABC-2 type transport system permease protein